MMKNFAMQKDFKVLSTFLLLLMIFLISNKGFAQENKVFNYKTLLEKSSDESRTSNSISMQSLVADLHTSISVTNGKVEKFGDGDIISLDIDVSSLPRILSLSKQAIGLQIIKIHFNTISELNSKLDLSELKSFPNLRFVYVMCPFEASQNQINNFFTGSNEAVTIIYTATLPR